MKPRNYLKLVLNLLLVIGLILGATGFAPNTIQAQQEPPPPINVDGQYFKEGRITAADIQAAALAARRKGVLPGLAGAQEIGLSAVMTPNEIPHFYGPFPNYANSPMPKGSISYITVDDPGTGYTAPTVTILDVYDTGSGATASATVANGSITGISVTAAGSGYTAPYVLIEDATGVNALATATLGLSSDPAVNGGIRKFVDSLPQLDTPNNLGQYIPIAVPDTTTFPGSDYYEIELRQYTEKLHSDLPPTTLNGYIQTNAPDYDPLTSKPHYLGPLILSTRDRAVRIKFTNNKVANGDFFLPVDTTVMGAGPGPKDQFGVDCDAIMGGTCEYYSENRSTVHLHGGFVPWISDGTPHQWTTPAGETTQYPKGVSVRYVPDMWFDASGNVIPGATNTPPAGASNNPGDGSLTFYYNNQQSARLQFYHDHAYGITRLNVYAGEAAGYLITDEIEQDLMNGTNNSGVNPGLVTALPGYGIPLIIQDKTFVDASTIAAQDPTWRWGTGTVDPITGWPAPKTGDLWVSSVYMPGQNPYDPTGTNAFGRWQYGPYFWPPTVLEPGKGPVANEYYDPACNPDLGFCEPPLRPGTPNPSAGMEAFMDTPVVNGTLYPYLEVDLTVVRFRILNAADDRFFNLHFYVADPTVVTPDGRTNTEVKMVPALATPGFPATWSADGREGGVPDPATMGPDWIQIGTEGGFLPAPVVIPPQPINWNNDVTLFNAGNVTDHSMLIGPAERADVLVDFSQYAGQTLILYNDAPAAFPANDPRYDYYTGKPDLTSSGSTPTTYPGYGPNTRTVMQVRVKAGTGATSTGNVSAITLVDGGSGYTSMPIVDIFGGGGSGATAAATGSVANIVVTDPGTGLDFIPIVTLEGGGGTGATAIANVVNGRIINFVVTNGGSGYTSAPTVILSKPLPSLGVYNYWLPLIYGGAGTAPIPFAAGLASLRVSSIALTNPGAGYSTVPTVTLAGGGGAGATAIAALTGGLAYDMAPLEAVFAGTPSQPGVFEASQDRIIIPQAAYNSAYQETMPADNRSIVRQEEWDKSFFNGPLPGISVVNGGTGYVNPLVTITGGGGSGAAATATIDGAGVITGFTITNSGSNYTSAPTISITDNGGPGTGAIAAAVPITIPLGAKAIQDEMGEAFDEYGRMSGFLGLELPVTGAGAQVFTLYPFLSPPTELLKNSIMTEPIGSLSDGTQIWKITHNGVDTHTIHVHLFNAQLVNRVAWDGMVIMPDANELGWKETFRVNPLEHTIFAFRPTMPTQPFSVPNSVRLIDPTRPVGVEMMGPPIGFQDPLGNPVTVFNRLINYGWEYVWHCHLLSHEEMDMMHSMSFVVAPAAPSGLGLLLNATAGVDLSWTDNSNNETSFQIMRANATDGIYTLLIELPADTITYTDSTASTGDWFYQVIAVNTAGDIYTPGFETVTEKSAPATSASITVPAP